MIASLEQRLAWTARNLAQAHRNGSQGRQARLKVKMERLAKELKAERLAKIERERQAAVQVHYKANETYGSF